MTDEPVPAWPSQELREWARDQAHAVRDAATEGGLRFQAYLPPELALWTLDRIEDGMFIDPSEAAFVLFNQARELEPHQDLRQELLKRRILSAADDPRPGIFADDLMAKFEAARKKPLPEPAIWLARQED